MIHLEDREIVEAPGYEIPIDSEVAAKAIGQLKASEERYYQEQLREMNKVGGGQEAFFDNDSKPDEVRVPSFSYHYWGRRLGYECWDDPSFRREYARDNSGFRRSVKPRQVTIPGGILSRKKFSKTFPESA